MLALAVMAMAGTVLTADAPEIRHDQRLERAAAGIVAARMGDLRGGLEIGFRAETRDHPQPVQRPRPAPAERRIGVWQDGLAIAIEKKTTVSPEL